jgi:hypothetical protein
LPGAAGTTSACRDRFYAARGATLGLLARRRDQLIALAASLPHPERHHIYAVDVLDRDALSAAAHDFIAANGGADVVVASAGISHGTLTDRAADLAVFDAVFATNVNATVATFAPFIPAMRQQATPCRLVGIGSVAGIRGMRGAGAYCASKAAVHSYCEALRLELRATNIRVVTIAPGYIDTPMTSKNRFPMPFLMPADRFAAQAAAVIARGDGYRVLPWQMGAVAKLLRLLPNFVFDRLFARAPTKQRQGEA